MSVMSIDLLWFSNALVWTQLMCIDTHNMSQCEMALKLIVKLSSYEDDKNSTCLIIFVAQTKVNFMSHPQFT